LTAGWILGLSIVQSPEVSAQSASLTGVVVNGRKFTGKVLFRDATTLTLLRRDGGLATYAREDVDSEHDLRRPFRPYPQSELEDRLRREFSRGYTVTFSEHFAVVYPTHSEVGWGTAFERLYRQFVHYFQARGLEVRDPEFPLIAVVLRSRAEFDRQLERTELSDPANVVGFYSLKSNRIITYDQSLIDSSSDRPEADFRTLVHEATHQSAFNTGIHERFRPLPRWVSEGLATMFEAPGVYDSVSFSSQQDRLSIDQLRQVQKLIAEDRFRGGIKSLVIADDRFATDPSPAYALAWALTFYLAEHRPEAYRQYLRTTTRRTDFSRDNAERRLADFCAAFGDDVRDLETRMMRFYSEMKLPTARVAE
jgi:hypothetical protein